MPASLKKLGISFNTSIQKGCFPHLFVNNPNISLNYNGNIPNREYFQELREDEYIDYIRSLINKNTWNLKDEAIKYCELDCISLYNILINFNNIITRSEDKWQLNMNNYPTLPSLSFAIFRTHYLLENSVTQISGKIYKDIKESYTGGSIDMYIIGPNQNDINEKIYSYDVNSLYPYVMMNNLMPVRDIIYFEGDIRKFDSTRSESFGYFYCKIITPDNLDHPILQKHIKTSNGIRTISPLGSF